jgi:prepilin-type N-terminal cleavage/methylation domain-containing protein
MKCEVSGHMRSRQGGFTLLEILIAIAILGIIAAMNSQLLQQMIFGTRQQEKVVSVQFETALGLDLFRTDLQQAGFGLPDTFSTPMSPPYTEATGAVASLYNDPVEIRTEGPPNAVGFGNNTNHGGDYIPNSDYLVLRSPALGNSDAAGKWTFVDTVDVDVVHKWHAGAYEPADMKNGYRMIIVTPRTKTSDNAILMMATGSDYSVKYGDALGTAYLPAAGKRYIAYGMNDGDAAVVRPFNRADYYVRTMAGTTSPGCAPNTGTLIKGTLNSDGGITQSHLIDCVANMQVLFGIDMNSDGSINPLTEILDNIPLGTANRQVKFIRVYLLAHEGTLDPSYSYTNPATIFVGEAPNGFNVNLSTLVGTGWNHYRWKIYTISTKLRDI